MNRLPSGGYPRPSAERSRAQRRAQPSEEAARRIAERIDGLAGRIQQFRIDAQRFFVGDLQSPPEELRDRIQKEVRDLRRARFQGAAQQFRLNSLEAQFNSHLDLFNRRLREREMGEPGRRVARAKPRRPDPEKEGVVVGRRGDGTAVEALYKRIYLRSGTRNPKMDLERFRAYLDRQVAAIRHKTGCSEVRFRISVENGKTKLKARPVRRGA